MAFGDVVGQDTPIDILQNGLKRDRVNHAYLFAGKKGVGKEFTAVQFAKALNCKERKSDACGECISCRKFNSGNHPDIVNIEPEGKYIKIDQIRSLQQNTSYKPYESEWKIYIIKQADRMNLQAANGLLRTLEEPPKYVVIILLASKEDLLLPTITSRCQIIKFRTLTVDEITDRLISRFELDRAEAEKIAILADGSLGKAIEFIENEDTLTTREIILDELKELNGLDIVEVFELVQKILDYKEEIDGILESIITFYRDLLLYKGSQKEELLINFDYQEEVIKLSREYTFDELQSIIEEIEQTNNLVQNTNVKLQLALEVMLLNIKEKRV
ncbi:DNA polymerase III subunit delta' [Acetohalobium arabaticum]|uniref:DNA polymerase III subunit delta' n=1 Tax=Acetohalobium arabaticum (strain ATCC 49924 / DSM 5501 / Z-7288) TaxID=574087 RepID=D9QSQ8_ACEAZ|nr:DNA polymerase III subunit delta' [Acetohalobium arabaticum]ADL11596.1 DNA polymerase III, delta prime subunit [Acetohalobium arabaticum DSM 5501]